VLSYLVVDRNVDCHDNMNLKVKLPFDSCALFLNLEACWCEPTLNIWKWDLHLTHTMDNIFKFVHTPPLIIFMWVVVAISYG